MFYQNQHFGISEYFCKETGENFSFPAHIHYSFEFITVLEGNMAVDIGDVSYELKQGEAVLIFPEQIHSLKSERSKHLLVIFSADLISAYYSRHSLEIPRNNKISVSPYLVSQISDLEDGASVIKIKAALYSVCSILDEKTEYVKKRSGERGVLRAIFSFVEDNYAKECTLKAVSSALGYNSSYLSRYFGEVTGMPFATYVNRYKISKACYMLKNTDKTVIECAYECGYNSLRSFNRNFKDIIGVPPREYRYQNKT